MGDGMSQSKGQFIGGAWAAGSGETFESRDPARGRTLWSGAAASPDDVTAAFKAARAAFAGWSRTPFEKRADAARAYKGVLEQRKDELGALIAKETGKPLWEALGEAGAMIGKIDISIAAYEERTGAKESETAFGHARMRHKANGVMAAFGPYNFPGHLPNGHIVPAVLAGDTVVFKPSELTPAVGEFMVACWEESGLPKGVVNLVQGARETGAAMLDSDELNGVLFTGSAETGTFFHKKFGGRPDIILALEMGGNNPLVVWDVSDVRAAASIIVQSAFITAGQRCSCARRLIVPEGGAGDAIVEAVAELIGKITLGEWDADPEPFMGSLISEQAAGAVISAQDKLISMGAKAVVEARRPEGLSKAFVTPGLVELGDTEPEDKEVFGPLLSVYRAKDFVSAIERANDTKFGLSAGLVSDSADLWAEFEEGIRAGIVNWNRPTTGAASNMPFGGPGFSGNHRPSAYYAADYCAYPVARQESDKVEFLPAKGLNA